MYRKIKFIGVVHQLVPIPSHTLTPPRKNGILKNGESRIGNYQILINANYIAISFTDRTSTIRVVKAKQMDIWFQKHNPICLKAIVEFCYGIGRKLLNINLALALKKSHFYSIGKSMIKILIISGDNSVNH